ncbi:MAG: hypothetical protein ACP5SB_01330 [Caldisericaceae bacterium]
MKKKNIVLKKSFWTKRNIILLACIILLVALGSLFAVHYLEVSNSMLSSHLIYTLQNNVVKSIAVSENLLIGTDKGDIVLMSPTGKIVWRQSVKSTVYTLDCSPDSNYVIAGGTSFHLYDINGKELFDKGIANYIPYKSRFIDNKTIALLYQSLSDLSFSCLTVDYTGKTINSQKINDLGETASLDLSQDGSVLFAGERGEVYRIANGKLVSDAIIDKKLSTVHQIFGFYLNNNTVVVGYEISSSTDSSNVPVYFYDNNLKLVKSIDVPGNINNFSIDNGNVIFATDGGFFTYSQNGTLQGQKTQSDLIGLEFGQNPEYDMYVYEKKPVQEKDKPVINVLLTDKNGNLKGSYLYTFDTTPGITLSANGKIIFVTERNKVSILTK